MAHIVLLGDSIFDNAAYVSGGPDVLSLGGNDALGSSDLLNRRASSSAEVLSLLANAAEEFEDRYRKSVGSIVALGRPLTVCTIYNGNLGDPEVQRLASAALTVFNDAILRVAIENGLPVIELRVICCDPADYANPIEPSVRGGRKIADAIRRAVLGPAEGEARTTIIAA